MEKSKQFTRCMGRWLMALVLVMLTSLAVKAAEAYACYTSSNTTLTFYYDNLRSSRSGTTYDLNTGNSSPEWSVSSIYNYVTQAVFDPSFAGARPTSTCRWFRYMTRLTSITGMKEYLNTSEVTDMCEMFDNCKILTSLDVSGFNTAKVTKMQEMFADCSNLTTIYAGNGWSTEAVTSSYEMFRGCSSLVGGQGTTYNADNVEAPHAHIDGGPSNPGYFSEKEPEAYACYTPENTTLMFYYDNLRSSRSGTTYDLNTGNSSPGWKIDGTNANVTKVVFDPSFADARPTSTYTWFYLMSNLQSITGISYLNTSQVTNMGYMFKGCESLTSLDLTHFNTEGVMSMNDMFYYCIGLTDLDLSSFNTANVTRMEYMFGEAYNLAHIVVGDEWSTTAVTNSAGMFNRCEKLVGSMGTTYDASHVDKAYAHIDGGPSNPGYLSGKPEAYAAYTSSNTTLTFYYDDQRSSRAETYDLNTDDKPLWFYYGINVYVTKVVFDPSFADARPTTTYGWFEGMFLLQSITGVNNLNTSEVTNTAEMFYGCNNLPSLDVSHFNTANVTDMSKMFGECRALTSLDLSHFNTANVTNMSDMFYDCRALTSLDVSNFNTAKATNMSAMFRGCSYLESLDLRSFNTANVTNMSDMFYGCYYLTSLDLSSFNTANVTEMNQMFYHCFMTTIYVGNEWSTVAVTNSRNMFYNCTRLVGGQGTTYDASHVDKAYAHIDGGPSNPGYLSGKTEAYAAYTADNTTLTFYYDGQRSLRTGTTYDLNRGSNNPGWLDDEVSYSVTHVVFDPSFVDARPDVTFCWFSGMNSLVSITGMREYLNTSEVRDMYAMFFSCRLLTDIDVSNFNTAKVTDMRFMFSMCNGLTSLDLSSFNTANVTEMSNMFYNCNHLTTIDVGSGWSTASTNYSTDMFMGCTSLMGGQGTTYDPSHVDAEYARIDGGTSNPGYFTGKSAFQRGDVNGDGDIDVADVTTLIAIILNSQPVDHAIADMNDDNDIDVADVTTLIALILSH